MFQELYSPATPFMSDFVPTILRRYAIARQWDDHDSGLNNSDKNYPDWGLTQQVFEEYVPTYPLPSVTPGIWQKFSYAQADCFILDCRSQRDPKADPDDVNKSMLDGNALGATGELQWLKDGLLSSTALWKIIFTSVVTNTTTKFPDGWAGYQTEWQGLRDFINSQQIKNVVFIAGDLHQAAIDNGSVAGFPEMCVSQPNTDRAGACATGSRGTWSEGYYEDACAGYGLVTVLQNPDRLILEAADEFGQTHLSYTVTAAAPPTPTPTATPTPTSTPTPTPTPTPSASPTATATATPMAPAITTQPANKTVTVGQTAKFSVTATGTAPLSYQWRKNGLNILDATAASSSYTTPPTVAADNGSLFSVVVSNSAGSVTSYSKTLTVNTPPSVTTQPVNKTVSMGRTAKFAVTATGTKF